MKLYINTGNMDKIIISINGEIIETDSRVGKSQMLLLFITGELEKRSKELKDITEIEVFLGPGSFTGLKVGISVANALSWSLDVPINGKKQLVQPVYTV